MWIHATVWQPGTELHLFEGRGHSLTIDSGWKDVAEVALTWFEKKGF